MQEFNLIFSGEFTDNFHNENLEKALRETKEEKGKQFNSYLNCNKKNGYKRL